jgi:putative membrane protein
MSYRISSLARSALRAARTAAAVAIAAGAGGCASTPSSDTSGRITSESPGAIGTDIAMATALGAGVTDASMFSDASIAAVGSASNQEEIRTSQLALQRAQDAQLRAYAQRMVEEHTRLEQQMQALLSRKGLAPADNALSLQLKRNLPVALDSLDNHQGRDFDVAFILHQIHAHDMALKTLDTSLIPEADDAELRAMLQQQVRPAVADHLRQAKQLHHAMMGTGSRPSP